VALFNSADGWVFPVGLGTNPTRSMTGRHALKFGGEIRWFQDFPALNAQF
jgi:hypothetical protein